MMWAWGKVVTYYRYHGTPVRYLRDKRGDQERTRIASAEFTIPAHLVEGVGVALHVDHQRGGRVEDGAGGVPVERVHLGWEVTGWETFV